MNPRILIIDDSRFARLKIEEVLRSNDVCSRFAHAEDGAHGVAALLREPCTLALCDLLMPDSDGFDFLRIKAAEPSIADVPVIILTAREDMEVKLRCLEAGAADYLVKPFHDQELVARVRVHLQLKELRDSLWRKNEELERLTRIDPLTGLANRLHLAECLTRELSRSRRHDIEIGLAILDIDHFKLVNDRYGHLVGDQVLKGVAEGFVSAVRTHDVVARFGGEEFAILVLAAGIQDASSIAERCREVVSDLRFEADGHAFSVTVSAGVTSYPAGGAESEDELLRQADQALYEAKRTGRDRLVSWPLSGVGS